MRWLFLIALLLNFAYLTWQMLLPARDLSADIPVLKNVESIVLLAEIKQGKKIASEKTTVDPGQKSVEFEAEVETVSVEAVIAEQADTEQADVVVKTAEIKDDAVVVPEEPVGVEVSQAKFVETESCFTLGPMSDLDKLRGFMREIEPYVKKADFRGQEENRLSVYWVYLPPEKNRRQAIKTGKRLQDKKVKDFYIVRKGEKNNGISLGYFKNKNRAFRLQKKVKKLGFDVLLEPVYKTYTVYWLDYQLLNGKSIPETIIKQYSQATKTGKTSRLSRDCAS